MGGANNSGARKAGEQGVGKIEGVRRWGTQNANDCVSSVVLASSY